MKSKVDAMVSDTSGPFDAAGRLTGRDKYVDRGWAHNGTRLQQGQAAGFISRGLISSRHSHQGLFASGNTIHLPVSSAD